MKRFYILSAIVVLIAAVLSCNYPSAVTAPPQSSPQASSNTTAVPAASPASTAASTVTATVAITHTMTPADMNPTGTILYDVDSSGTASQHRAPYGDSYNINLFERPFTQKDMTYIPSLDINAFQIASDANFYYVFITLIGSNPNDPANIDYGVEIDKDRDGFGDMLVWAQPLYTTTWTTDGVKVYTDPNHDTGGASPEKSDANATTTAPYPGDGYETVIFNQGQGDDPDLAWVRIDPKNPNVVDFAFKQSLAGHSFMWGAWADAGLKNPGMFNYNDRFTLAQAGSPLDNNSNYPINAIYAVDNTCRAAYGFTPTGYEPGLCPTNAPPPPKAQKTPGVPPPVCKLNYNICISQGYGGFNSSACVCTVVP